MTLLSRERLLAELADLGCAADRQVLVLDDIDSTSSELARLLKSGADPGTVVAAEQQRAGRGRQGRTWFSPPGGNLFVSLAVSCGSGAESVTAVPLAAGVAAVDAVSALGANAPLLKWPNDLLVNDLKVGGILCEVTDPRSLPGLMTVGLGLNLGRCELPPELDGLAGSLAVEGRERLAAAWIAGLEHRVARLGRPGQTAALVREWRERAEPFGRRVRVGEVVGVTVDLDAEGRLLIERDDGLVVAVVGGIVENVAATIPE